MIGAEAGSAGTKFNGSVGHSVCLRSDPLKGKWPQWTREYGSGRRGMSLPPSLPPSGRQTTDRPSGFSGENSYECDPDE